MSDWKKFSYVMGLALSLPSTILGVSYLAYTLYKKGVISEAVALGLIIVVTLNIFYVMIRYVLKRKNQH